MHISGNNFQLGYWVGDGDYYFSSFSHIWGWATWGRAWKHFSTTLPDVEWFKTYILHRVTGDDEKQVAYWARMLEAVNNPAHKAWSYNWLFSIWLQKGKCIIPNKNLVKNIGFGENSTHTKNEPNYYKGIMLDSLLSPNPPTDHLINFYADTRSFYIIFCPAPRKYNFYVRLKNKLKMMLSALGIVK
jgi:hypothetical protein